MLSLMAFGFAKSPLLCSFLFLLLGLVSSSSEAKQYPIPPPSGKHSVFHNTTKLTDVSRSANPFNDTIAGPRNVMISLFYPLPEKPNSCLSTCSTPYMPPNTTRIFGEVASAQYGVAPDIFENFTMNLCCNPCSSATKDVSNKFPLVLFSPGFAGPRLLYNFMAAELASKGYVVVTMDHDYETVAVEYPDGNVTLGMGDAYFEAEFPQSYNKSMIARVADARFVLSELGKKDVVGKLIPGSKGTLYASGKKGPKVGFFGHSFGGATAITTLAKDKRFAGALNMDGSQAGLEPSDTIGKPAVLFGRAEPNFHNSTDDKTWAETWDQLKGWRREIGLRQSAHTTFSDSILLLELKGLLEGERSENVTQIIGSLEANRALEVIGSYVEAFMGFVLKGKKTGLFNKGGSPEYPEVVVGDF